MKEITASFCMFLGIVALLALCGCADLGERDNPTDPMSRLYAPSAKLPDDGDDEGEKDNPGSVDDGDDEDVSSSDGKKGSSSSANSSSSKTTLSSSSVETLSPCKTATDDNCVYGTLVDDRDGKTYKTVTIGSTEWMAENLAYIGSGTDTEVSGYGRYYTWAQAVDSLGVFSSETKGCGEGVDCEFQKHVRGICPEGWFLPDSLDWANLLALTGGSKVAGTALKSTLGWNGDDSYGFGVMPAGQINIKDQVINLGSNAYFWSSKQSGKYNATHFIFSKDALVKPFNNYKGMGISVRCVREADSQSDTKTYSALSKVKCADTDYWCKNSSYIVKTPLYTSKDASARWTMEDDHLGGGLSAIQWPLGVTDMASEDFNTVIDSCEGLCGTFELNQGQLLYAPYVKVIFSATGHNDTEVVGDATSWRGLCVTYMSDMEIDVELGTTKEKKEEMEYALPFVTLPESSSYIERCMEWPSFKVPIWAVDQTYSGKDAAAALVTVEFKIDGYEPLTGNFNIVRVRSFSTEE